MEFSIKEYSKYNESEILNLYQSVGWINYTNNPNMLKNAYTNSLKILAAYENEKLLGIIRVVGDGYSIVFIQDIIVLNEYQGKGFGSKFLKLILDEYRDIRQIILLTEDSYKTIKFYENNGLTQVGEYNCVAFMK